MNDHRSSFSTKSFRFNDRRPRSVQKLIMQLRRQFIFGVLQAISETACRIACFLLFCRFCEKLLPVIGAATGYQNHFGTCSCDIVKAFCRVIVLCIFESAP